MKFSEGLNAQVFFLMLLKYLLWTGFHLALLYGLLYLDNERKMSENLLAVCMIPLGIINMAVLVNGLLSLKIPHWRNVLYATATTGNFVLYILLSMQMYSQAGAIVN